VQVLSTKDLPPPFDKSPDNCDCENPLAGSDKLHRRSARALTLAWPFSVNVVLPLFGEEFESIQPDELAAAVFAALQSTRNQLCRRLLIAVPPSPVFDKLWAVITRTCQQDTDTDISICHDENHLFMTMMEEQFSLIGIRPIDGMWALVTRNGPESLQQWLGKG
jgi:hypothetical protein